MADKNQGKISGTWDTWHRPTLLPNLFVPKNADGTTKRHGHEGENLDVPLLELQKSIKSLEKRLETADPEQKAYLRKSIESCKEKYEKLKSEKMAAELAEASKDIRCERQKVQKLEEEKSENQKKIEQIEKEKEIEASKLKLRVQHLQKKLDDKESATHAAQSEVESLEKETDELKRRIEELEKESQNTAIQSTQRIEKQKKEFIEAERQKIKALTRDIEQLRAELKEQEDNFKSQLQEKEDKILRVSNQLNEQQAEFEACLREKEQLQKNYDADMEESKKLIKKQHNIESTLRSELKELQDTVTKIEADKRLELEELTKELNELKKEHDEIGEKLDEQEKVVDEQEKVVDKQKQDIETLQAINENLTEAGMNKESELQDTRDQLQKVKDKLAKNIEEKDEVIASLQQAVEGRSETVSQMKQTLDQQMMRANELLETKQNQINDLVEKLQVKEAQSAIYKQDFETERNDRQKLHQSFTDLQGHCEYLKQELTKEEEKFTIVQRQHHELQQEYANDREQLIKDHYKLIASMTDEGEKTKGELTKAKEQLSSLTKEKKRLEKQIEELKQGEIDRVKEMEEEIQVLTAQVNAYSREVDRQKVLVAQSQEKHKTEVIQLQEKFGSELSEAKSKTTEHRKIVEEKQQLVTKTSELERNLTTELKSKGEQQQLINELNEKLTNKTKAKQQLTQQFDTLSANYEKLMTAYHEERAMVTRLEDKIKKMKQANVVLKDKLQQQVPQHPHYPLPPSISARPNSTPTPVPEPAVQSDGDSMLVVSKTEGVAPARHTDSDSVPDDSPAFMSKEEMARMFNRQGSRDWNQSPQQVEDSPLAAQKMQPTEESLVAEQHRQELAREADDALLEVDRMRKQADLNQQTNIDSDTQYQSRPMGQLTREEAEKSSRPDTFQDTASKRKPVHSEPNVNDNQGKRQPTDDDSDSDIEENKLIDGIDEEIQQMAEDVRKRSKGPTTAEVLFDDGDSSLPYDPNLVCPKCGKQYRVGEIQKLRRHMNEFCTGIR